MYYKPTKFNQHRWSHFWENKFFFLMWTTLNFRGRGKTKKTARDIYMRTLYIKFERDRSIGLGSTLDDGHTDRETDRHTHTQTFFLKTFLDSGSDVEWKIIKKSKSKILTKAILPSSWCRSKVKIFVYWLLHHGRNILHEFFVYRICSLYFYFYSVLKFKKP